MSDLNRALEIATPVVLIALGVGIGFLLERTVLARIQTLFESRHWSFQAHLIGMLRRVIVLWGTLAGVYAAVMIVPMPPNLLLILRKLLLVLVLGSATLIVGHIAADLVDTRAPRFLKTSTAATEPKKISLLANIAQITVFIIGILIILQSVGVAISPLLTALGVGGLAVALALQGLLSNIFSGLEILASHYVRPGDYIKLDSGGEGFVLDINWRNTTIRDLNNNLVIVPNDKLASAVICNYHLPHKDFFTLSVDVPVSQDNDLERVERSALDVAKEVLRDLGCADGVPEPYVRFDSVSDDGLVKFSTFVQARDYLDGGLVRHNFIKRLHERFASEGIKTKP